MIPVLPASYFGSIAYFRALAQHPVVEIEAKEHFPKQTYRNRCDILGGDGILSLSIPTKKPSGNKTPTDEIILSNEENWRIRHWRAINSAYQAAPYFDYYGMEVEELLLTDEANFLEYTTKITRRMLSWLDIETELGYSTGFRPLAENDPRAVLLNKDAHQEIIPAPYIQVFPGPNNYRESLSLLDAIFCEGPMARKLIVS